MAGNIEDKAKYALREYDVERGGGCTWYVTGFDKVKHKFTSCVYENGRANHPAKVVRILKEQVILAGMKPKSYVPPATPLERYEGSIHKEGTYEAAKEAYEVTKEDTGAIPEPIKTNSPLILVAIFIGVLGYWLFGSIRKG